MLASILRNTHRAQHARASQPEDFFPSLRDRPAAQAPVQSPEQMLSIFQMITGAKVIQ